MATISPFRAWRYASDRVSLSDVVTQPYDKISPAMQEGYYKASPYNLVRIILGKHLAGDNEQDNVYSRAAASFEDWRKSGVLRQDSQPSLYSYSQTFAIPGTSEKAERRGFIAAGQLEEYSAGIVFRHEQTLSKPKADRLNLLRSTRAHFGQIFMLYSGGGKIDSLLESSRSPEIKVTDEYGVVHRVWKVSDAGVNSRVQEEMKERNLIIADGHHRYETALAYRNERRAGAQGGGRTLSDSVMMTFVDMDRPGLVVLPTHRLVFGLAAFSAARFQADAGKYFKVEEVDSALDETQATGILRQAGATGTALLAVSSDRAFLLHSPKAMGTALFSDFSPRQQALDVVQLHKCVLETVLHISEEAVRNQQNVSYCRETGEALAQVRSGKAQIAFLMNPVRMEQVRDIAFAGEVLPQKSTDFYPKLLSGLTIYALD